MTPYGSLDLVQYWPDSTKKPLPEPVLTYHQRHFMTFTQKEFNKKTSGIISNSKMGFITTFRFQRMYSRFAAHLMALCWCWAMKGERLLSCNSTHVSDIQQLTHWGRDKMDAISQTTLSNAFLRMKMLEFWLKFHWSLFLRVQLTVFQHWLR